MQVDFYHLTATPLDRALPQIAEKVVATGGRLLIVTASEDQRTALDRLLWTYTPESFLDVMAAMYENQPNEGGPGLGNNALADIVRGAGVDDEDVIGCVTGESFTPWVKSATERSNVRSTPTIIINGTQWDPQATDFPAFVTAEITKLES